MIHGTDWTGERLAMVRRLVPPPGYRVLTILETVSGDDLTGWYDGSWRVTHPANVGRRAGAVIAAARKGEGGPSEAWVVEARPENYMQVSAIDRAALEKLAAGADIEAIAGSAFWECLSCGATYRKDSPHICGFVDA